VKPIPQRPSMLDPHRDEVATRLDAEPTITAVEVLVKLRTHYPDRFGEKHLRTTQRTVKAWRAEQGRSRRSGSSAAGPRR
jgi:hypothetical protein